VGRRKEEAGRRREGFTLAMSFGSRITTEKTKNQPTKTESMVYHFMDLMEPKYHSSHPVTTPRNSASMATGTHDIFFSPPKGKERERKEERNER